MKKDSKDLLQSSAFRDYFVGILEKELGFKKNEKGNWIKHETFLEVPFFFCIEEVPEDRTFSFTFGSLKGKPHTIYSGFSRDAMIGLIDLWDEKTKVYHGMMLSKLNMREKEGGQ